MILNNIKGIIISYMLSLQHKQNKNNAYSSFFCEYSVPFPILWCNVIGLTHDFQNVSCGVVDHTLNFFHCLKNVSGLAPVSLYVLIKTSLECIEEFLFS